MQILRNFNKHKKIFFCFVLFFFSISFNQYYGYLGILPIDSFLVFNSGYDFLNGKLISFEKNIEKSNSEKY